MTILSRVEAALVLRVDVDNEQLFDLLALVDGYVKNATGVDWASVSPVPPVAKNAARMLLVMWYENPGGLAQGANALGFGLTQALLQLEAEARKYVTFEGLASSGYITVAGLVVGSQIVSVTGIVNVSGDYASSFATYIEHDGLIEQTSSSNLDEKWFRAYIKPLEDQ